MGSWKACQRLVLLFYFLALFEVEGYPVDITILDSAVSKGAVCLDGSPPAYHFSKGFDSGANNWLVLLQGGGWCSSPASCLRRKVNAYGSSRAMEKTIDFSGILSNVQIENPDFYNWNKVKVRYCDGSSFTGDVEDVDPDTGLHYRGARIFQAVMEDLLAKGMKGAKEALLTGCSAGALAAILHCDRFSSLLPRGARVKCLSDAGYFINAPDITGEWRIERFFQGVFQTHGPEKSLARSCTSRINPFQCFFPQNFASDIRTPLFILNGAYDSWQIQNILASRSADPRGTWKDCRSDIKKCSREQIDILQGYRDDFLLALRQGGTPRSRGFYISSCFVHCEAGFRRTWLSKDSPMLDRTAIGEAVGDWYYDRKSFQRIDCRYPCNKSCLNRVYQEGELEDDIYAIDI